MSNQPPDRLALATGLVFLVMAAVGFATVAGLLDASGSGGLTSDPLLTTLLGAAGVAALYGVVVSVRTLRRHR